MPDLLFFVVATVIIYAIRFYMDRKELREKQELERFILSGGQ